MALAVLSTDDAQLRAEIFWANYSQKIIEKVYQWCGLEWYVLKKSNVVKVVQQFPAQELLLHIPSTPLL
jgi:endo-beta-N-acetylglucosaminidase D